MDLKQRFEAQGIDVRRFEYDDGIELAADFGPASRPSVDVVGDTIIVLADGEQYDITAEGDAQAFINNGVLTIEVER